MNISAVLAGIRRIQEAQGFITYADVDVLVPVEITTETALTKLFNELSKNKIVVYNSVKEYEHFTRKRKRRNKRAGGPIVFRDPVDRYAQLLGKTPKFTPAEITKLLQEISVLACAHTADTQIVLQQKRNLLISGYLRLVFSLAGRYVNRGVDYIDLVQEGNQALVEAVAKIKQHIPTHFTSYITALICDAMLTTLHTSGNIIKLPRKDELRLKKLKKGFNRLEQFVETINHDDVRREACIRQGEEIRQLSEHKRTRSLSAPVYDGDMSSLSDYIADAKGVSQTDTLIREQDMSLVHQVLTQLPSPEQELLRLRYGLAGEGYASLPQVAEVMHITFSHARNLEERALRHLAMHARTIKDSQV